MDKSDSILFLAILVVLAVLPSCWSFSSTSPKKASIVTGANGYVAREVVQELLRQSPPQSIYCLVREARIQSESSYWKQKSDSIQVLPYDMLDGGSTVKEALKAARECHDEICIYHIASVFGPSDDHVQTAKDNVQGTEDLVNALAVEKSNGQRCRLVVISSMAAVRGSGQEPLNGKWYTDKDWNNKSQLGDNWGSSYQWSKAQSERRAWELSKANDIPMTAICPSFVFGPPADGIMTNSYSIELVGQWVWGKSEVQSRLCVDVRDLAKAIVAAGNKLNAIGQRFIVSKEERVPSQEMAEALQSVCLETGVGNANNITYDSKFQGGAIPIGTKEVEATAKLEDVLGITLRTVEETIGDMGRTLLTSKETQTVTGNQSSW